MKKGIRSDGKLDKNGRVVHLCYLIMIMNLIIWFTWISWYSWACFYYTVDKKIYQ